MSERDELRQNLLEPRAELKTAAAVREMGTSCNGENGDWLTV
jgi:hypothetical protein